MYEIAGWDRRTLFFMNDLTEEISRRYKLSVPVINSDKLIRVVRRMGGSVEVGIHPYQDSKIVKNNNSFIVIISSNENEEWRIDSIIRALGRLFLQAAYLIDDDVWNSIGNGEFIRNYTRFDPHIELFKRALMMPKEQFCDMVDESPDVTSIARYFGVKKRDVIQRGHELGFSVDIRQNV